MVWRNGSKSQLTKIQNPQVLWLLFFAGVCGCQKLQGRMRDGGIQICFLGRFFCLGVLSGGGAGGFAPLKNCFSGLRSWSWLLTFDTQWAGNFGSRFRLDVLRTVMTNFDVVLSRNHIRRVRSFWWWSLRMCDDR